jgi:hypothetical protein
MFHETIDTILKPSTISAIGASVTATCELLDPERSTVGSVALTPARVVAPAGCSTLKRLLLDPRSWYFAKKRCLPRETALFQLHGEQGSIRLVVGFSCLGWIVTVPAERQGGFFDPVASQIRELLKSTFPEFASPGRRSLWRAGIIAQLRSLASAADGRPHRSL